MQTFTEMPYGYRWMTTEELVEFHDTPKEDRFGWMNHVEIALIGQANSGDYIVPWDCMIEFGMDHNHDPVECERILADMNPEFNLSEHYDGYGNKEYF